MAASRRTPAVTASTVSSAFPTDRFAQAVSGLRYRRERPGRTCLDEEPPAIHEVCGNGAPRVDTTARPIHVDQSHREVLNLVREAPDGE